MVRFDKPCQSVSDDRSYFAEHMRKGDYLSQNGQAEMVWVGQGARQLGLEGTVKVKDFVQICEGRDPHAGEKLMVRENPNWRTCYFGQISAPKDVSLALLVTGDYRIRQWWEESCQETLREIEASNLTRVRKVAHESSDRVTGNMVTAVVTHDCQQFPRSAIADPHVHHERPP